MLMSQEAGRNHDPRSGDACYVPEPRDMAPLRGMGTPDKPIGFFDATMRPGCAGGARRTLYERLDRKEAGQFMLVAREDRSAAGQATRARHALRNGPYDFKPRSRDGLSSSTGRSPDDDLARLLRQGGAADRRLRGEQRSENLPGLPRGCLLPPPKARICEPPGEPARTQARDSP